MALKITTESIESAYKNLKPIVTRTPLTESFNLSERYDSKISLKREDLQIVRSYKLRGAYNKISTLPKESLVNGVVCASAGNHSQGVAYTCFKLGIKGTIFMPSTTPEQKVKQAKMFGKDFVDIRLIGDTFDDSYAEAVKFSETKNQAMIHPFNDEKIIEGQGTVAIEILEDMSEPIDYIIVPIGGGGLASGVATYIKEKSPNTKIIGVEPDGAPSMKASIDAGKLVRLDKISKFVDGAAVQEVGDKTFEICKDLLDEVIPVPEGLICSTILKLYNEEAIIVEPAGALTTAALELVKDRIKGKNVVCIISGSNNDITRTEEIKERSMLYEGLKHYFIIRFPQRPGALREFLVNVLGPSDNIVRFEYTKKNSRESGPALVGLEIAQPDLLEGLFKRLKDHDISYEYVNEQPELFHFII